VRADVQGVSLCVCGCLTMCVRMCSGSLCVRMSGHVCADVYGRGDHMCADVMMCVRVSDHVCADV